MRVLFITNLYPPHYLGGYEILCQQMLEYFRASGWQGFALTSMYGVSGPITEDGVIRRLHIHPDFTLPPITGPKRRWIGLINHRKNYEITSKVLEEIKPDLVFFWSLLRLTLGPVRAVQERKIPNAFSINDESLAGYIPAPFSWRPRKLVAYILDRTIFRKTTLLGVALTQTAPISGFTGERLQLQGVPIRNPRIIYQGIALQSFPIKGDLGTIHNPARILYVGQLLPQKGVHTLVEACALLTERLGVSKVVLTIVGGGSRDYELHLKKLAEKSKYIINFLGKLPREQLWAVYQQNDIFVFPSILAEGFGLTFLEAMAVGLPVVSTVFGGHREVLVHEENALVFSSETTSELVDCLERIIADDQLRIKLIANGRKLVEETCSFEKYAESIRGFIEESHAIQTGGFVQVPTVERVSGNTQEH